MGAAESDNKLSRKADSCGHKCISVTSCTRWMMSFMWKMFYNEWLWKKRGYADCKCGSDRLISGWLLYIRGGGNNKVGMDIIGLF